MPSEPFGTYVEGVLTGNLLFMSGMLPTDGCAKFVGRVGAELDVEAGRKAAQLAALNVFTVANENLGRLDKVIRIVSRNDRCGHLRKKSMSGSIA